MKYILALSYLFYFHFALQVESVDFLCSSQSFCNGADGKLRAGWLRWRDAAATGKGRVTHMCWRCDSAHAVVVQG